MGSLFKAWVAALGLGGVLFVVPAAAQSNAEWQAFKARCGINPGMDYNSWVASGSPCGAGGAGSPVPGAPNPLWVLIGKALGVKQTGTPSSSGPDPSLLRAHDLNDNGVAAYKSGDYQTALQDFEQAARFNAGDPVIQNNLKNARTLVELGNRNAKAAANIRILLQSYSQAAAGSNDSSALDFDSFGAGQSGKKSGSLGFDSFDSTQVVDARNVPSGLPKSVDEQIPHTPDGDRVRKGFEAIADHDWKLAAAWFGDALNHDPQNAGIARLVDLAQYTYNRELASPPPAHSGGSAGAGQSDTNALVDRLANAHQADRIAADAADAALDKSLMEDELGRLLNGPSTAAANPMSSSQVFTPDFDRQVFDYQEHASKAPSAQASPPSEWRSFIDSVWSRAQAYRNRRVPGAVAAVRD